MRKKKSEHAGHDCMRTLAGRLRFQYRGCLRDSGPDKRYGGNDQRLPLRSLITYRERSATFARTCLGLLRTGLNSEERLGNVFWNLGHLKYAENGELHDKLHGSFARDASACTAGWLIRSKMTGVREYINL
jgi:hypothetical protein